MDNSNWVYKRCLLSILFALYCPPNVLLAETLSLEGDAAFDARNYRMAVVHYQRALRQYPDNAELMNALAKSYDKRGESIMARDAALRAVEKNKDQVDSLLILARYEFAQREFGEAVSFYEQVLSVDAADKAAQTGLIEAYQAAGMADAANDAMEEFEK